MTTLTDDFTTYVEETGNYIYVGKTARGNTDVNGALWQIMRVDTTSDILVEWADASNNFDKIWADRGSYVYK